MTAFGLQSHSYDAVLFVSGGDVVKEMLYGEFEAVLDGVVGEPDFANQTCEAVYVKLDTELTITSAVFFTLKFGRDGQADPYWNLPLIQMAETADLLKEIGGSGVRIVCSSQCQTPWHQSFLWEPDLSSTSGLFSTLQEAINANRLGFIVEKAGSEQPVSSTSEVYAQAAQSVQDVANVAIADSKKAHEEMLLLAESLANDNDERAKFATALKKLRLQMANLKQRHQQELETERIKSAQEKEAMSRELLDSATELDKALRKISLMATSVTSLQEQLEDQKTNFEKSLQSGLDPGVENYDSLRQTITQELEKQHNEQLGKLRDMLEMRSLELHYREEKIAELERELQAVCAAQVPVSPDSDSVLRSLKDNDVHFVVSLPAVGPLNIPYEHLDDYLADSDRYLAARLNLDLERFNVWREHAERPICSAKVPDGDCCGQPINVVLPHEFVPGVSDCCEMHRIDAQPRFAVGS